MDPVTHALLGGAIAYAIGGQILGRHAATLGALAAITPDIDHFIRSEQDPLLYVEYHRAFTHALAFSVVGAILPMLPWAVLAQFRNRLGWLWFCSLAAYVSHCLLDASTTWGTQLLWPFTRVRVSWDVIAIVDPLFTLGLAGAFGVGLVRKSRRSVVAALVFAAAYLCLGVVQHARASAVQRQLAAGRGHTPERSEVMPTLGNNLIWRSLYLANGKLHADRVRVGWFSRGTAREGTALPLLRVQELGEMEAAASAQQGAFDRFAWFTDGWVARAPADPTIIGDMRYSRSTESFDPVWGIRISATRVEWVSRERDRKLGLGDLWKEIWGNDARYRPVTN